MLLTQLLEDLEAVALTAESRHANKPDDEPVKLRALLQRVRQRCLELDGQVRELPTHVSMQHYVLLEERRQYYEYLKLVSFLLKKSEKYSALMRAATGYLKLVILLLESAGRDSTPMHKAADEVLGKKSLLSQLQVSLQQLKSSFADEWLEMQTHVANLQEMAEHEKDVAAISGELLRLHILREKLSQRIGELKEDLRESNKHLLDAHDHETTSPTLQLNELLHDTAQGLFTAHIVYGWRGADGIELSVRRGRQQKGAMLVCTSAH